MQYLYLHRCLSQQQCYPSRRWDCPAVRSPPCLCGGGKPPPHSEWNSSGRARPYGGCVRIGRGDHWSPAGKRSSPLRAVRRCGGELGDKRTVPLSPLVARRRTQFAPTIGAKMRWRVRGQQNRPLVPAAALLHTTSNANCIPVRNPLMKATS